MNFDQNPLMTLTISDWTHSKCSTFLQYPESNRTLNSSFKAFLVMQSLFQNMQSPFKKFSLYANWHRLITSTGGSKLGLHIFFTFSTLLFFTPHLGFRISNSLYPSISFRQNLLMALANFDWSQSKSSRFLQYPSVPLCPKVLALSFF